MDFNFEFCQGFRLEHLIIFILIIGLVIWVYFSQYEERNGPPPNSDFKKEGNGEIYYKGRGSEKDNISVLLDRLDWISNLERRTSTWERFVIPTVIATILVGLLAIRKLPEPTTIVILVIVIFLPFLLFHSYYYIHGDYYADYYIRKNTDLIRDKLDLNPGIVPDPTTDEIPDRVFLS